MLPFDYYAFCPNTHEILHMQVARRYPADDSHYDKIVLELVGSPGIYARRRFENYFSHEIRQSDLNRNPLVFTSEKEVRRAVRKALRRELRSEHEARDRAIERIATLEQKLKSIPRSHETEAVSPETQPSLRTSFLVRGLDPPAPGDMP